MNSELKPNDKLYTWQEIKLSFILTTPINIELSRHDCQRINAELLDIINFNIEFKDHNNTGRCYMGHGFSEDGILLIKDNPEHMYISVDKDVEILGYTTFISANEDEEGKEYYDFEPISGMIDHLNANLLDELKTLYKIGAYIDINSIKIEIMPFDEVGEEREPIL